MADPTPDEALAELRDVLHRLVLRLTRRSFATPRQMQMDVGTALAMLGRVEFPRKLLTKRSLMELLPELGRRRPNLQRHVTVLEESVLELRELTGSG